MPIDIVSSDSELFRHRDLKPQTWETITKALQTDAVARRVLAKGVVIEPQQLVGVRLNLNVLRHTGVAVHSIHKATSKDGHIHGRGFFRGEVISYQPVVVLQHAYFSVHQGGREGIASSAMAKHPMASVDGEWIETPAQVDYSGIEISCNPKTRHLFTDERNFAVQYAESVTILGARVYARGVVRYFDKETAPKRAGTSPSAVVFRSHGTSSTAARKFHPEAGQLSFI